MQCKVYVQMYIHLKVSKNEDLSISVWINHVTESCINWIQIWCSLSVYLDFTWTQDIIYSPIHWLQTRYWKKQIQAISINHKQLSSTGKCINVKLLTNNAINSKVTVFNLQKRQNVVIILNTSDIENLKKKMCLKIKKLSKSLNHIYIILRLK